MKQIRTLLLLPMLLVFMAGSMEAQERYKDEVFDSVTVTTNVEYGMNWSFFPVVSGQSSTHDTVKLYMDVYEPKDDSIEDRPLIIHAITGTFLPAIMNTSFTGERADSFNVEFATRMARMGYVVAVVQYRRGWLFLGTQTQQQKTILQAAYRGIQDMRTAVRYFRKEHDADSSTWKINPDKIVVGGTGTGGYMSYGAAYLKRFDQVLLDKFFDYDSVPAQPFVDTTQLSNPYGTTTKPLNVANHVGYSSDFNVGYALGGALGDSSWVEAGDPPFLAMQTWQDPAAPFRVGDVLATDPGTGQPFAVIGTASGAYTTLERADMMGNQEVFKNLGLTDPVSARAATINDGIAGLYPFITPFTPGDAMCLGSMIPGDTLANWISPWYWFEENGAAQKWDGFWQGLHPWTGVQAVCSNKRASPNDAAHARTYIDTIVAYLSPRIFVALELDAVGIDRALEDRLVKVFPNPSNDRMVIRYEGTDARSIDEVLLMDITGRVVKSYGDIKSREVEIHKGNLTTGMYLLQIRVDDRVANRKILFN